MIKLNIGITDGDNSCAFLIDIQGCDGPNDQWAADIADMFLNNPFPGLNMTSPYVSWITVEENPHEVTPNS